ncbi:MAG: DUF4345 family protein [Myxococcota bacterium]|nr:DUF4345 family protein [Myxococcota bacterium]
MIRSMADVVVVVAIAVYGVVGLLGIVSPPFEFTHVVPTDFDRLGDAGVTVLNQIRFFKGLELAAAAWMLAMRRELFVHRGATLALCVTLGATVTGRLASVLADGVPHPLFVALIGFELLGFAVVALASAQALTGRAAATKRVLASS